MTDISMKKISEMKTIFSIQWRCNHTPSSTGVLDNTKLQNPLLQNYHRNKTTTQKSIENRSSSFNSASVHLSGLALPLCLLIKKNNMKIPVSSIYQQIYEDFTYNWVDNWKIVIWRTIYWLYIYRRFIAIAT